MRPLIQLAMQKTDCSIGRSSHLSTVLMATIMVALSTIPHHLHTNDEAMTAFVHNPPSSPFYSVSSPFFIPPVPHHYYSCLLWNALKEYRVYVHLWLRSQRFSFFFLFAFSILQGIGEPYPHFLCSIRDWRFCTA
jgi:hypothetical protein